METVLITGGTGLVGKHLGKKLLLKGYRVTVLTRKNKPLKGIKIYTWNYKNKKIDKEAIETANYIIHLAGANIAEKRWSEKRKQLIIDSRVKTAQLIYDNINSNKHLKAFISASAIGIYGTFTSDKIFSESDLPASDFLGKICYQWEQTADRFQDLGFRTVKLRTGVVLTRKGGALSKIVTPVNMGIGSAIGSGNQYLPWIHIDDLCDMYIKAIEDVKMRGAYNAVSPTFTTNKEFTQTLAKVLKKPFWFPNIPSLVMKIIFGEMSDLLLKGSRISADKILTTGFRFKFPNLESALINLLKK